MSIIHGQTAGGAGVPLLVNSDGSLAIDGSQSIYTSAATLVNGTTIFTIAGGPILIIQIGCVCISSNGATASTLQYSADGTDGAATTITGASASLANVTAGTIVAAVPGTLATAPAVYANGVGIAGTVGIIVPAGIITTTVGVGSTTGTWRHFLRWQPLAPGVTVA